MGKASTNQVSNGSAAPRRDLRDTRSFRAALGSEALAALLEGFS